MSSHRAAWRRSGRPQTKWAFWCVGSRPDDPPRRKRWRERALAAGWRIPAVSVHACFPVLSPFQRDTAHLPLARRSGAARAPLGAHTGTTRIENKAKCSPALRSANMLKDNLRKAPVPQGLQRSKGDERMGEATTTSEEMCSDDSAHSPLPVNLALQAKLSGHTSSNPLNPGGAAMPPAWCPARAICIASADRCPAARPPSCTPTTIANRAPPAAHLSPLPRAAPAPPPRSLSDVHVPAAPCLGRVPATAHPARGRHANRRSQHATRCAPPACRLAPLKCNAPRSAQSAMARALECRNALPHRQGRKRMPTPPVLARSLRRGLPLARPLPMPKRPRSTRVKSSAAPGGGGARPLASHCTATAARLERSASVALRLWLSTQSGRVRSNAFATSTFAIVISSSYLRDRAAAKARTDKSSAQSHPGPNTTE